MLSGWDRLRFRGTLRVLASVSGLNRFLSCTGHLLKDFGDYALRLSREVRGASLAVAEAAGRPVEHLNGPSISKEDRARAIAEREWTQEGLITVLTAVEPCWSYNIRSDRSKGHLQLYSDYRKCQHVYHYQIHPIFGFMHVRLQTWMPFNVHVCLNGREWLARQMDPGSPISAATTASSTFPIRLPHRNCSSGRSLSIGRMNSRRWPLQPTPP